MRKKRRRLLLCALLASLGCFSCATTQTKIPSKLEIKEGYYYNLGFSDGLKAGERIGKAEEQRAILNNLTRWEKDIVSLRVGKYLIDNGYLDKGQIYVIKEGKAVKEKVSFGGFVSLSLAQLALEKGIYIPDYSFNPIIRTTYKEAMPKNIPFTKPFERFYYKKGFKAGYESGYAKGVSKEREKALEDMKDYERKILSLELSKYMNKETLLTYPRAYKVKEKKYTTYVFVSPQREKIRSLSDILKGIQIPPISFREQPKENRGFIKYPETYRDHLPVRENEGKDRKLYLVKIKNGAITTLERMNISYIVKENDYYAAFDTLSEKESFCETYKICIGGVEK